MPRQRPTPADDGPPARTESNNDTGSGESAGDLLDLGALAGTVADLVVERLADLARRRYLSVARAAEYADLSEDSIRSLLSSGRLTPLRPVPGRVVIDRRELDALVLSSTGQPRRRRGVYKRAAAAPRAGKSDKA